MTIYPTVAEVISVHASPIDRFGGSKGIREIGGIESALARPQIGYYRDLIEEAAAMWHSLSQNHPFIDGNKRVAVTVAIAFLRVNGCRVEFTDEAAFTFLLNLGCMRLGELDMWIREHAGPRLRLTPISAT